VFLNAAKLMKYLLRQQHELIEINLQPYHHAAIANWIPN